MKILFLVFVALGLFGFAFCDGYEAFSLDRRFIDLAHRNTLGNVVDKVVDLDSDCYKAVVRDVDCLGLQYLNNKIMRMFLLFIHLSFLICLQSQST